MSNLNTFSAKKLGEVLAFAKVGVDTFKRSEKSLLEVFTREDYEKGLNMAQSLGERIEFFAKEGGIIDQVSVKQEATEKKLTEMRDMYIGDEWDNPAEILEWLGFFEGAAMVHWGLVRGVNHTLQIEELGELAHNGFDFYEERLSMTAARIIALGSEKAREIK